MSGVAYLWEWGLFEGVAVVFSGLTRAEYKYCECLIANSVGRFWVVTDDGTGRCGVFDKQPWG